MQSTVQSKITWVLCIVSGKRRMIEASTTGLLGETALQPARRSTLTHRPAGAVEFGHGLPLMYPLEGLPVVAEHTRSTIEDRASLSAWVSCAERSVKRALQ